MHAFGFVKEKWNQPRTTCIDREGCRIRCSYSTMIFNSRETLDQRCRSDFELYWVMNSIRFCSSCLQDWVSSWSEKMPDWFPWELIISVARTTRWSVTSTAQSSYSITDFESDWMKTSRGKGDPSHTQLVSVASLSEVIGHRVMRCEKIDPWIVIGFLSFSKRLSKPFPRHLYSVAKKQ